MLLEEGSSSDDDSDGWDGHARPAASPTGKNRLKLLPAIVEDTGADVVESEVAKAVAGAALCDLSRLQLSDLPPRLAACVALQELCARENKLRVVPVAVVAPLHALRIADFSNNDLTAVPLALFQLPLLESLLLDHNRVSSLPITESPENAAAMRCSRLHTVGLEWNVLDKFPTPLLERCPELRNLYLAENLHVQALPAAEVWRSVRGPLQVKIDNRPKLMQAVESMRLEDRGVFPTIEVVWNKIYPDRVLDFLYLGSLRTAQAVEVYRDLNIGFVLTAGRHLQVKLDEGMEQLELAVDDLPGEDMSPFFTEAFAIIGRAKAAGRGILIHCFAGLSRSVTLTVAYLMHELYPLSRDDALALVRQSRPSANPNAGFLKGLQRWEAELKFRHGDGPAPSGAP